MNRRLLSSLRRGIAPVLLIGTVLGTGVLLAAWKHNEQREGAQASANQPEPVELVTVASAARREHHQTATAIGTVLALRSITLRNELPGTVRRTSLTPGRIVDEGTVLVALDVSVEEAELSALRAEAQLADTMLERRQRLLEHRAIAEDEVDQARAQRDVAHARMAQLRAVIARKTLRAPFRARVGLADVHPGQYLEQGVELTSLQGVSDEVNVDFAVAQSVAAGIRVGSTVQVVTSESPTPLPASVVAVDARVDAATRNATVRARLAASSSAPAPGASVRVLVPVGKSSSAVAIPVSALRKGPDGDHVWVVADDGAGVQRAHERMVESGPVLGEAVLVLGGLTEGEQVAAAGSFKLRDGVRVQTPPRVAAVER
ncbi:MAG: efflux RND transporter periplasmic adaptor subunit, partial [Polyangiaceae bacterium]